MSRFPIVSDNRQSFIFVPGDPAYYGCDIASALAQRGAWYLLLRVHDKLWYDRSLPFAVRYEAMKQLWNLCNEVGHSEGRICQPAHC